MVKWLVGLLIALVVLISSVYVLIPGELRVSKLISANLPSAAVSRYLTDSDQWTKWWPDSNKGFVEHNVYKLKDFTFHMENAWFNQGMNVIIRKEGSDINSTINILPLALDSVSLLWKCSLETSDSPFERIKRYQEAKDIKEKMSEIFDSLETFLSKKENVYDLHIEHGRVKDTLLASTRTTLTKYPSASEVYSLIGSMKHYISEHGSNEMNYPMMNVSRVDSNRYNLMVAVAIDKAIKENGVFENKRMVPGKLLVAEVIGGPNTIKKGFIQLENYMNDYQLTAAAIPFQLMVTDRIKQPDSAKWITKLCYPVY
jgi:hypothetical protein